MAIRFQNWSGTIVMFGAERSIAFDSDKLSIGKLTQGEARFLVETLEGLKAPQPKAPAGSAQKAQQAPAQPAPAPQARVAAPARSAQAPAPQPAALRTVKGEPDAAAIRKRIDAERAPAAQPPQTTARRVAPPPPEPPPPPRRVTVPEKGEDPDADYDPDEDPNDADAEGEDADGGDEAEVEVAADSPPELPEKIVNAAKLQDVLRYFIANNTGGEKDQAALLALCEQSRDAIPMLGRIKPELLGERIGRTLQIMDV